MSKSTLIEVGDEAVGIVVPDGNRVRFVAVKYPVWALDDQVFASAEAARRAARDLLLARKGGSAKPRSDAFAA
ncbi:hypothetical protein [Chthonobacter albigriseus]|uniref:hypothetical protein n=1 Tax=Chthonobacter albigriseus TaxID=1683161 RepID=UPI0015EF662C|nr:hypothetical protein [Chthonobacter albigriseus]